MKKIFLFAITLVMAVNIFAHPLLLAKSRSIEDELKKDAEFIEILKKNNELTSLIISSLEESETTLAEVQTLLLDLQNNPDLTENQIIEGIQSILHFPENVSIEDYVVLFRNNWESLQNRYGSDLTDESITRVVEELYLDMPIKGSSSEKDCKDKAGYAICSAAAASAAILGHMACVGATVAAPLCFILIATIEVAAINQCSKEFCGQALTK